MHRLQIVKTKLKALRRRRKEALYKYDWLLQARPKQLLPQGEWWVWMILAGRGFGKTRTGAETLRYLIDRKKIRHIGLIGQTIQEVKSVMVEGESGLLSVFPPRNRPRYEKSRDRLVWENGATATFYGGDHYESLRGPQFDMVWVDELAKFREPEKTWQQIMMCLRLGESPRAIITTTPRPLRLIKDLSTTEGVVVTKGTTFENAQNLSRHFIKIIKDKFHNTTIGRQELMGEMIETAGNALWTREMIERNRSGDACSSYTRIVVAVDPAVTSHADSDETGIIVAALGAEGCAVILEDLSLRGTPLQWARAAVEAYHRHKADRVVAEVNMGGELVEQMLRSLDASVSYKAVRATRGKDVRAEPIAALYEQGKVKHKGCFPQLEDQMCSYVKGESKKSPDRMDALVWALTDLMLKDLSYSPEPVYW